uniref:CYRIA/CYRIB Rac1 binding domain-containing protein n=1 Tax=Globodera rostochiensis TaxID=31243 RepID=A0A914HGC8_GLORO
MPVEADNRRLFTHSFIPPKHHFHRVNASIVHFPSRRFFREMPEGIIKSCVMASRQPNNGYHYNRQQRCLNGHCLHLPALSIGSKVADATAKFSPKLSIRSKSHHFEYFQPELAELLNELRECILDGNTVVEELERFKQNDGDNLHKEFPVNSSAADETGEDAVRAGKTHREAGALFVRRALFFFLLAIVVRYDTLKSSTPALQNAFSLYRRMSALDSTVGFHLLLAHQSDQISLFLARPTPMLCSLVNGAERFIGRWQKSNRDLAISHMTGALLVIYKVLKHMVERMKPLAGHQSAAHRHRKVPEHFLRSMAGILLLFDHIDSLGVFSPHSPFDIVDFVEMAIQNSGEMEERQLLATLRFFSKNFNSPNTAATMRFSDQSLYNFIRVAISRAGFARN